MGALQSSALAYAGESIAAGRDFQTVAARTGMKDWAFRWNFNFSLMWTQMAKDRRARGVCVGCGRALDLDSLSLHDDEAHLECHRCGHFEVAVRGSRLFRLVRSRIDPGF